jgi:hypothetical protein
LNNEISAEEVTEGEGQVTPLTCKYYRKKRDTNKNTSTNKATGVDVSHAQRTKIYNGLNHGEMEVVNIHRNE